MTNDALPAPPVPPYCDCTDLDGFMLNVEKLMASELVALANHEQVAAALFVWCRAWKQIPAASLPDDDDVIAAFARLPVARFRKHRAKIMRGFKKCSDGRLYHSVLAAEALVAFEKKVKFRNKREGDAERLRKWRENQKRNAGETGNETSSETHSETTFETRFVPEGQGQGQGQGQESSQSAGVPADATSVRKPPAEPDRPTEPPTGPDWDAVVSDACRLAGLPPGREVNEERTRLTWIAEGLDPERDVLAAIRAAMAQPSPPDVGGLAYFTKAACRLRDIRLGRISAGAPGKTAVKPAQAEPDDFGTPAYWRRYVAAWDQRGRKGWGEVKHGPEPINRYTCEYDPDCRVPTSVLAEFGIGPLAATGAAA